MTHYVIFTLMFDFHVHHKGSVALCIHLVTLKEKPKIFLPFVV